MLVISETLNLETDLKNKVINLNLHLNGLYPIQLDYAQTLELQDWLDSQIQHLYPEYVE